MASIFSIPSHHRSFIHCGKKIFLLLALSLAVAASAMAQQPDDLTLFQQNDLAWFQLNGPVKRIVIEGMYRSEASFNRNGHLTMMTYNGLPVSVHRNATGAIDSLTTRHGRVEGSHNTKYRQRATDERGNWIARKTQQLPYIIGTEYCHTEYYE